jgi:hypothetical protein
MVPPGALRVEGLNAKPRRLAGVDEVLNTNQCDEARIYLSYLIVEDWRYLKPLFLRFFILMIWHGLGWF